MSDNAKTTKQIWDRLIYHAVNGTKQRSFNVNITFEVEGQTWHAYGAEVSHRDILFFCKEGSATFLVDSYGGRHVVELFNWSKNDE